MPVPSGYRPIGVMRVTDPHNAYGFQDQPGFTGTDRISDLSYVNAYEQEYMRYDPVARCCYAEPMFVPHHNLRASGTELTGWVTSRDGQLDPVYVQEEQLRLGLPDYPLLRWSLVAKSAQTDLVSVICAPLDYTGLRAQLTPGKEHDATGISFTVACNLPSGTRGIYAFKRMSAGREAVATNKDRNLSFELWVSSDRYYRIDYSNPFGMRLYEYKDGRLRPISKLASTQSFAEAVGQERYVEREHGSWAPVVDIDQTAFAVLLVNGLLQIWMHGQAQPVVINSEFEYFSKMRVIGKGGSYVYFSVHPMCFATNAYLVANERNVGFVRRSSTPIRYRVHATKIPEGSSATASTAWEQGQEFRYKLNIQNRQIGTYKGQGYARDTAVVTGVTYEIAPYSVRRLDAVGEFRNLREVRIVTSFDLQNLNIYSRATVVMNNRHGEWREGWPYGDGRGKGNRAVSIDLGWQRIDGVWTINRRFTGIGGLDMDYGRGAAPESTVRIECEDLSCIPREYPLMSCPWMDGWCHYYAIRYLAWLSGITDAQMEFEYCGDPYCSNPDHYHLPIGDGLNPRMYFPPGTTVWQAMNRIRALTGHVLFFDAFGKLKYYPWIRTAPGPFKRLFFDGPDPRLDPFQVIEQASFARSTRSVRTGVTIVGVNAYGPAWDPILAHRSNPAALYDRNSPNYKGFRSPLAWADPMFANRQYAEEAADAVNILTSLPGETISITMLGMSDLFPLDVIGIYDSKMPTSDGSRCKAFFITQTVETFVATRAEKIYRMQIDGRWIV